MLWVLGADLRLSSLGVFLLFVAMAQAALFGTMHLYQGPAGAATAGAIGLAFGLAWWIAGRNLWAGILLHGLFDSLAMTAAWLGLMPHR